MDSKTFFKLWDEAKEKSESEEHMSETSKAAFYYGAIWMLTRVDKLITEINENNYGQQNL